MDGHFVPNITIGPLVVGAVAPLVHGAGALVDVHLMIERPRRYVEVFAAAGRRRHHRAPGGLPAPAPHAGQISEAGAAAGVALNPGTPVETLAEARYHCDLVLDHVGRPGIRRAELHRDVAGQAAPGPGLPARARRLEVDGGVNAVNAAELVAAGANLLVAGSSVFDGPECGDALRRQLAQAAAQRPYTQLQDTKRLQGGVKVPTGGESPRAP